MATANNTPHVPLEQLVAKWATLPASSRHAEAARALRIEVEWVAHEAAHATAKIQAVGDALYQGLQRDTHRDLLSVLMDLVADQQSRLDKLLEQAEELRKLDGLGNATAALEGTAAPL